MKNVSMRSSKHQRDSKSRSKAIRRRLIGQYCFEILEQRQVLAAGVNPVVFIPGFGGTFADVVDSSGDLIAEPTRSQRLDEWYSNRGLDPSKLALEPHGQVYQSFVKTLENVGYVPNQTLFVTNWDWRVPVAPVDGVIDGLLAATYADITDATFDTGLDYLAYTLKAVKAANPLATAVDLVTHSTGGLIARAYMQSSFYGDNTDDLLPVGNLVMAGVPNRGVTETWNLSLDDWAGSAASRAAALLVNQSYDRLQDAVKYPGGILGADPNSTADDITNVNISKQDFAQQYVGAMRDLLPEFPAVDLNNDGSLVRVTAANQSGTGLFNNLLLDLNATANAFINSSANTTVIYSTEVATKDRLVKKTGPSSTFFNDNEILPFSEFIGHTPGPNEVWYQDIKTDAGGDGTVPSISSIGPFIGDTNSKLDLVEITASLATGGGDRVAHRDLVINEYSQTQILTAIGASAATGQIETGLALSTAETVARALALGIVDFNALFEELKLTAADIASFMVQLGDALETMATKLNVPSGIPFVSEAITTVASFVDQTNSLTTKLYKNAQVTGDSDITATNGRLSADTSFVVRLDSNDPVTITVQATDTATNTSINDLYVDINSAIATAGLASQIIAERPVGDSANRFSIRTVDPSQATSLDITTLQITGNAPAPSSGRLGEDVDLSFTIKTKNLDAPVDVNVVVTAASTTSNTRLRDLARDINEAMAVDIGDGTLLNELLVATVVGDGIRIAAVDSTAETISVIGAVALGFAANQGADDNPASSVLGIGVSQSAIAELAITTIPDLVELLNRELPTQTTLAYDEVKRRVSFELNFEETYQQAINLDFSEAIDLGFADLNLAGGVDAVFQVTAGANLTIGLDLIRAGAGSTVDGTTQLTNLRNPVVFKVAVTSTGDASATTGPLAFNTERFDGSSESVSITLSDISGLSAEDVSFALADKLAEHFGVAVDASPVAALVEGNKLVLVAQDPSINRLQITSAAYGFLVTDKSNQPDLVILLADGTSHEVVLDGAKTLGDIKTKIEAAANVTVSFVDDRIQIVDGSTPVDENRLTISAATNSLGTSTAGVGLGILGSADTDDDVDTTDFNERSTLLGDHLLMGSILDQFFIDTTNSSIYANATLTADDIDLTASLGLLELGIGGNQPADGGTADFVIGASIALTDADGMLRLSEVASVGVAPAFNYSGDVVLPISIPLLGQTQPITLTLASDPTDPLRPTFSFSGPSISDLKDKIGDFKNMSLADIAGMLRKAVELLRNSDIDGLNTNIPVINQSPNDLLDFTDGLLAVADDLLAPPDVRTLKGLRDQFAQQIDFTNGSPEQLAQLSAALEQVSRKIDPVHTYEIEISYGGSTFTTGMVSSTATAMDVQASIDAALDPDELVAEDQVTVAGRTGGPFTFTFNRSLGDVSLSASSPSGLTVQFATTTPGVLNTTAAVIASEFVTTAGLATALVHLRSVLTNLGNAGVDVTAMTPILDQMSGGVISTANLSAKLTALLQAELGLPVSVNVAFLDADLNASGNQNTIKLELDINPTITRNVGFDLSLDDFGPVTIGSAGNLNVMLGGNIQLDLGYNFASATPYVFDSTSFAITANINSTLDVTAGIGGFEAGLDGTATLTNVAGTGPAAITVSIDQTLTPSDFNTIGAIPIRQLFSGGLSNTFDFTIDGVINADFDAKLPGIPNITDAIKVDYTIAGPAPTIDYANLTTGVNNYLASLTDLSSMSLDQLISGTRTILTTIESGLTSDLLSNIPLVGDGLDMSASFVGELQTLLNEFEALVNTTDDSVDALIGDLQELIYDALGPLGANILKLNPLFHDDAAQSNGTEVADWRDVEISLSDFATTAPADMEFFINLHLAGRDVIDADFDLGLDAVVFEFETAGGVELSWDYDFNFGFGINLRDGFFFQLNENTNFDETGFSDGTGGAPEISLGAQVNLKPGTSLKGELFFLNLVAESNPIEDYNGNGVLDANLNEAVDGTDYNRDGDMDDVLSEVDSNGDGRLSRGTGLSGDIFIDVNNPDNDAKNRLTFGELRGAAPLFSAGIRTEAFVDLALSADTDAGSNLPKLTAGLTVDWGLSYSTSEGFVSGTPEVAFHDVSLDLGSFFDSIAGPAFELFEKYIEPARPVIDFLRGEVPGFSDISVATGGPKITFLDLGAYAGGGLGEQVAKAKKVLDTISGILDAVEEIKSFAGADGMIINFGDFILSGGTKNSVTNENIGSSPAANTTLALTHAAKAGSITVKAGGVVLGAKDYTVIHSKTGNTPTTSIKFLKAQSGAITVDYVYTTGKMDVTDATTQVSVGTSTSNAMTGDIDAAISKPTTPGSAENKASAKSKLKKLARSAAEGGHGLSIPILKDPSNVFKLLTGETVDLIQWKIPTLDLNIPFSARFGPLGPTPIFAKIGANVGAKLDFSLGFDTRGISQTGNFFDGLYFGDRANVATGEDIDEVSFNLGVNVGVGVDIGIASVYLVGAVRGDMAFNWNDLDGDGKLYFDELVGLATLPTTSPIPGACVFDAHGGLTAQVGIEWSVGVSILQVGGYIPIVDAELFSFTYTCTDSINIATLAESGDPNFDSGTLVLNAGPLTALRNGTNNDVADEYIVRQVNDTIEVDFNLMLNSGTTVKLTRQYPVASVKEIFFDGGAGDDKLIIDSSVSNNISVVMIGGAGNDILTGHNGSNVFVGGAGDDTISGGTGNDTYLFENNWGKDKITDIGGDNDRFDFSAVTVDLNVTLGSVSVSDGTSTNTVFDPNGALVEGIESMVAGVGNDTLILNDAAGTTRRWTIDSVGGGNIDQEFYFERFENLTAGQQNDTFAFTGGSISGVVNGGSGIDVLNYAAAPGAADVNRQTSTATSVGSFTGIESVIGSSGSDTLIGANANATWNVTGADQGNIEGSFQFQGFENLTGGDSDDTFVVSSTGSISGRLRGTTTLNHVDKDKLDLSAKSSALTATIQGVNHGLVTGGATVDFVSIENLTGGSANDHFVIESLAGLTETLDGGGGLEDHLDYSQWNSSVTVDLNLGKLNEGHSYGGKVAGIEHVSGGSANDTLTGNASNNRILGLGGSDTIHGMGGDNVLIGDRANITLGSITTESLPGDGDDTINAGDGHNFILPGSGNDIVVAGNGNNSVLGDHGIITLSGNIVVDMESTSLGGGDDEITLGGGSNLVIGGEGDDTITVGSTGTKGQNVIIGDRGSIDRLNGRTTAATSQPTAGSGNDTITTGDGIDVIIGGGKDDTIHGGARDNYVLGDDGTILFAADLPVSLTLTTSVFDGHDTIRTLGGRDIVFTGNGDNTVHAGDGHDDVIGGSGIDILNGETGNDWLVGLLGDDVIVGGSGLDLIFGGLAIGTRADYYSIDNNSYDLTKFEVPAEVTAAELTYPTGFMPKFMPIIVSQRSIDGTAGDGRDDLDGGNGNDVVFGGADADVLEGGSGADYIDAGAGHDTVEGGVGNDIVRGGEGNDVLYGGVSTDILIGDAGDDELRGEDGGYGQRLFGGDGRDSLYAFTTTNGSANGDQLFGGSGGDFLYGADKNELLSGDSGNDYIEGRGGADTLLGGGGEDQLYGGDGNDTIWGGTGTDFIEGQAGNDIQYGGGGIDLFVLEINANANDTIDGHFGNESQGDAADDNATDILTIDGTSGNDTILIATITADGPHKGKAGVRYNGVTIPVNMLGTNGKILVEQFRIAGLAGNDTIGFITDLAVQSGAVAAIVGLGTIDLSALADRSKDWVGVFDGNSGNDILIGSDGRDRLDGGLGSDTMFGFGGDDRLWGDGGGGASNDIDTLYAGQGNDDLIGGQGKNNLYAWSFNPARAMTQLGFTPKQTAAAGQTMTAPMGVPNNGKLLLDVLFELSVGTANPVRIFIPSQVTSNNSTPAHLVADLQAAINAAGINGVIVGVVAAGADAGKLTLIHALSSLQIDRTSFGVYVDAMGNLTVDDFDLNDNGLLDSDEVSPIGPYRPAYTQEVTGLNRLLGSSNNDTLHGGTTLDFMYGNGGNDVLIRADGSTFESMDGGLAGDEWKEYAKESDLVWYIGGTNAADQINVDFVTEPGLLTDHHLVTRLTNNNGNFSFSAQVRLDFGATDDEGNAIWNVQDLQFKLDELLSQTDAEKRGETLSDIVGTSAEVTESELIASILPPEGDFLVILVDALGGDDVITVGPTVQKTVWIDAGSGDDIVDILSGNAILVDKTESSPGTTGKLSRNDIPTQAYQLTSVTDGVLQGSDGTDANENGLGIEFNGLTMDSPSDVDWYRFTLADTPTAQSVLQLSSGSPIDNLGLEIYGALSSTGGAPSGTDANGMVSLSNLAAGGNYYLKVTNPNKVPTPYSLRFNLTGTTDPVALSNIPKVNLGIRSDAAERRDVIIGGTGDDILRGGAGEDWIFGNEGNDVLTGGMDRNSSDLLFGGDGDDSFQIIPDALPLLGNQTGTNFDAGTQTYIPTFNDQLIGGAGEDHVLYLGGDKDRRGFDVPDYVSMRYNTGLQRYEFTSLVWDIGKQGYRYNDINENGVQDAGEDFEQQFMFFQTRDVESFTIDTQAGNDVVRLDSEFQFLPLTGTPGSLTADTIKAGLYEEWGMDRGDAEQGAHLPITILGGAGDDFLFGSPSRDVIIGGLGDDLIVGGLGDDELDGEGGDDRIFGNGIHAFTSNPYPYVPPQAASLSAAELHTLELAPPRSVSSDSSRPGVDLNSSFVRNVNEVAFGLEGSANERLQSLKSYGDVNSDGYEDFIASGQSTSYVFLGPMELSDLEDAISHAEIIIDHTTLGRPAEGVGDINADGIQDYVFLTSTDENLIVRVIFGTGIINDRIWNGDYWTRQLPANQRTIELPHAYLSSGPSGIENVGLNVLPFFNDTSGSRTYSDILIHATSTTGVFQNSDASFMTGLFFSGQLLNQSESRTLGIFDRSGDIVHATAQADTSIKVVSNVSSDGATNVFVNGSSVQTVSQAASALVTTPNSVPGYVSAKRGITSKFTIGSNYSFNIKSVDVLVTPTEIDGDPTNPFEADDRRMARIVDELNASIQADPNLKNRLRVLFDGTQIQVQSVERGFANSVFITERVLTDPFNLFEFRGDVLGGSPVQTLHLQDGAVTARFQLQLEEENNGPTKDVSVDITNNIHGGFGVQSLAQRINDILDGDVEFADVHASLENGRLVLDHPVEPVYVSSDTVITTCPLFGTTATGDNSSCSLSGASSQSAGVTSNSMLRSQPRPSQGSVVFRVAGPSNGGWLPKSTIELGDINRDRLADLAIVTAESDLDIFFGSSSFLTALPITPSVKIISTGDVNGATSGDFDGDGNRDLAVQYQPTKNGPRHVAVFSNLAAHLAAASGTTLDVSTADLLLSGNDSTESFATHATTLDLNSDGLDDLILGAADVDTVIAGQLVPEGGRIDFIYGTEPFVTVQLPTEFYTLENFSVSGSGSFVVERGNGEVVFDNGGEPFTIDQGEVQWFRFTTLGDGRPGDVIRLDGTVKADLIDDDGRVLIPDQSVIDLRTAEAGTYYLRVNGTSAGSSSFRIHFDAPIRGQQQIIESDASPDRDMIRGGDGDDIIAGGHGLDRIFGGSGRDTYTAEAFEIRDRDLADGLSFTLPPLAEQIQGNTLPSLDPIVIDADAAVSPGVRALQFAIARELGHAIGVRTDGPLLYRDVRASQLAALTSLEARAFGITDLSLLNHLPNLETLDLSGNPISDSQLAQLYSLDRLRFLDLQDTAINWQNTALMNDLVAALPNLEVLYLPVPSLARNTNLLVDEGNTASLTRTRHALNFDGVNDFLSVASPGPIGLPIKDEPYTLAAWIRPDVVNKHGGIVGWGNYGTTGRVLSFRLNNLGGIQVDWWGEDLVVSAATLSTHGITLLKNWNHVATTYDDKTRRIFVNGIQVAQDAPPIKHAVPDTQNFTIGRDNTNQYFDGQISDVGIWNRALSPLEISQAITTSSQNIEIGRVAYWPLNQGPGGNFDSIGVPAVVPNNSDFESLLAGAVTDNYSDIPGWTKGGGLSGLSHKDATPANGLPIAAWLNGKAPYQGSQIAFIQGGASGSPVSFFQNLTGLTVGEAYRVRFFENERGLVGNAVAKLRVLIDGTEIVATHNITSQPNWTEVVSNEFIATSSTMQLRFEHPGVGTGDNTVLIDAVEIVPQSVIVFTTQPNGGVTWASSPVTQTVALNTSDDGPAVATVLGDPVPYFVWNVNPSINVIQATGVLEGQVLSIGSNTGGKTNHKRHILVNGNANGGITVTDPGVADVPDLVTEVMITNPAGQTTSLLRTAVLFDDDSLALSNNALDNATNFTTAFWLKTTGTNSQTLLIGANDSNPSEFAIQLVGATALSITTHGQTISWTGISNLRDGSYHHIAITRNLATNKAHLFVDGIRHGAPTGIDLPVGQLPLNIGAGQLLLGAANFVGSLDEFAIWDRALSETDIAAVRAGFVDSNDSNLRLYLPFDEGAGEIAVDRGPLGLDVRLSGGASWTSQTPTSLNGSYTFANDGMYTLTVTARDDDGGFDQSVTHFVVGNVAPVINDLNVATSGPYLVDSPIRMDARDVVDAGALDKFAYLWEVISNNGQEILASDDIDFSFTPHYAGEYTVTLTVTDNDGGATTFPQVFAVNPKAMIGVPATDPPATPTVGQIARLSSANSSQLAPAGLLRGANQTVTRKHLWTITAPNSAVQTFTTSDLEFVPLQSGNYSVTLQITDNFSSGTPSLSHTSVPFLLNVGAAGAISIAGSMSASEGDVLNFSIAGLSALDLESDADATRSVVWTVSGGDFTVIPVLDSETYSIRVKEDATFSVNVTVTDTLLSTPFVRTAATANVVVNNAAPTVITSAVQGIEGSSITLVAMVSDADSSDKHSFTVNWGDGSTNSSGTVNGGSLSATHTFTQQGSYTATLTVTDVNDPLAFTQIPVVIVIDNVTPVAANDSFSTDENTPLNALNLFGNDTDVGTLDVLSVLSVDKVSTKGARVSLNQDGSVTYEPGFSETLAALAQGTSTTDTFTYIVTDNAGSRDVGEVTITVSGVNDAPRAIGDRVATDEDAGAVSGNVLSNDTDVDTGSTLSVTEFGGLTNGATVTGAYGVLTWTASGAYTYTLGLAAQMLTAEQRVTDVFSYTVSDQFGAVDFAALTISIQGSNDGPMAGNDSASLNLSTGDVPNIGSLFDNDSDIDGSFEVSAVNGIAGVVGLRFELPTGALLRVKANGEFEYDPNGAFDDLAAGATRLDTFSYTITDKDGASSTATVTMTVTGKNDAPTGVALSKRTIIASSATNTIVGSLATLDVDSGDSHTLTLTNNAGGRFALSGSAIVVNAGVTLVAGETHLIQLQATDAANASVHQAFVINVVPAPVVPNVVVNLPTISSDDLTIRINGANIQVVNNAGGGAVIMSQPIASTNSITITGAANISDTLTIDYASGGFFQLVGGISFNGGVGGNDQLRVLGKPASTHATYVSENNTLGDAHINIQDGVQSSVVRFTGVEPIDIHSMQKVSLQGIVNVGEQHLSIESVNAIDLGVSTLLSGGTITAQGVLSLGAGDSLVGFGNVAGRISGDIASNITATGALSLGVATANDGFITRGQLQTGAGNTVTLRDANQAVLGSMTTLGGNGFSGVLEAVNGYLVESGNSVTGFGTLSSTNDIALQSLLNGSINGTSPTQRITLNGYYKGIGTFNNVNHAGTYSPGFSPAQVVNGGVAYSAGADILLELGGTVPGSSGHDQLIHMGLVELGGNLQVAKINNFNPTAGNSFVLMTSSVGFTGEFDSVTLPAAPLGSDWELVVGNNEVRLNLVDLPNVQPIVIAPTTHSQFKKLEVKFDGLVDIDLDAFTIIKRGQGGGVVSHTFTLTNDGSGNSVVTISFTSFINISSGALVDGNYQIVIDPNKIRRAGTSVKLDGNSDGLQGGTYQLGTIATDNFFAYFGDINGNRVVDPLDSLLFRRALNKPSSNPNYDARFDSNNNGVIDPVDSLLFRRNLNKTLGFE